jgi:hypothetical protein
MRLIGFSKKSKEIEVNLESLSLLYQANGLREAVYQYKNLTDEEIGDRAFTIVLFELRYKKQVELLLTLIRKWTSQYASQSAEKWTILQANCKNCYDSSELQKLFKASLETIYLLLTHKELSQDKKIQVLNSINAEEFTVCGPGIYTHLQDIILHLKSVDEFSCVITQVITQMTHDFINDRKRQLVGEYWIKDAGMRIYESEGRVVSDDEALTRIWDNYEIHYANGFRNFVAKQFGMEVIVDSYVDSLRISSECLTEFKKTLKKELAPTLIQYLVRDRIEYIHSHAEIAEYFEMRPLLDDAMIAWFGKENRETINEHIFDAELKSGNYYKNTFLSEEIIHYYTIEALIKAKKLSPDVLKKQKLNFLIDTVLVGCDETELALAFCEKEEKKEFIEFTEYIPRLIGSSVVDRYLEASDKEQEISHRLLTSKKAKYFKGIDLLLLIINKVSEEEVLNLLTFKSIETYLDKKINSIDDLFELLQALPKEGHAKLLTKPSILRKLISSPLDSSEFVTIFHAIYIDKPELSLDKILSIKDEGIVYFFTKYLAEEEKLNQYILDIDSLVSILMALHPERRFEVFNFSEVQTAFQAMFNFENLMRLIAVFPTYSSTLLQSEFVRCQLKTLPLSKADCEKLLSYIPGDDLMRNVLEAELKREKPIPKPKLRLHENLIYSPQNQETINLNGRNGQPVLFFMNPARSASPESIDSDEEDKEAKGKIAEKSRMA